ncbi:dnaA initiator-associating protein [Carex rostrata]
MSLAIVERQGPHRPVAGCVGVLFFHLLDWNRRLARKKKKRVAKRSLLPPLLKRCPKQSSRCPDPHSPPPPQLTSSKESQVESTTRMQAPGLVARLMGLESMPVSKPGIPQTTLFQPTTGKPSKFCSEALPLKMQKTSNGSGDRIINSDPTHLRKYHHNSTCSSARSPRARLIQAASKILEPGLRPKLSLSPLNSSVRNIEENVAVGSLLGTDVGTFSKNEMEPPKVNVPAKTNILEDTRDTREDALNYIVRGKKCVHVEQKGKNSMIYGRNIAVNYQVQRNSEALCPVNTNKAVPKMRISGAKLNKRVADKPIRSGYLEPKKNVNHVSKSGTISNTVNTTNRKRRTSSDMSKKKEPIPFYNSSRNGVSPKRISVKKENNRASSSVSSSRVKPVSKRSSVNGGDNQTISLGKERLQMKDYSSNLIVSILEDLVSEFSEESGLCLRSGSMPCCDVSQGEKGNGLLSTYLATMNGDQPSPISILETSFSIDSCSLGSPVNETEGKMLFGSTDTIQKQTDFDSLDMSSETTSNSNLHTLASRIGYTSGVFSNIELLFGENRIEEENFSVHSFLLDLLKNILEAFGGSLNGEQEGVRLTNFLFDCIIEFFDRKYSCFCKSGYKGWLIIYQTVKRDQLLKEILKEMQRWSEMGGKTLSILADSDMGNSIEKWSKCRFEGFEIGVEIESAIIHTLVDEFVFDLC